MQRRSPFSPSPTYLDPVTGNIIIQVLLAGAAAVAVTYNNLKTRVQAMMGKKNAKKDEPAKKDEGSEDKPAEPGSKTAEEAAQTPVP